MTSLTSEILFEKFQIIEVLKKDEHAAVFLANHIYLSKKIILKVLNTQKIPDPSVVERFKREAKILARLDHSAIIKVLDFGTSKEFFYISFEYIEGESLRNVFKTRNLTPDQKEHLMIQFLRGLGYAHANQIIHRDIKPENIFIDKNLNVKLGDFGLALSAEDNFVTNPYSIVGTPSYMSPEQVRGAKLTPQSDLFSTGVVLFELFSGKNPFLKDNISMTLNEIIGMNESSLEEKLNAVPEKYRNVLLKLLKKNVNQRYQTVDEVFKDLNIQPDQSTLILKDIRKDFGRTRLVSLVTVAVILIIAGIVFIPRYEKKPSASIQETSQPVSNRSSDTNQFKQLAAGADLKKNRVDLTKTGKPLIESETSTQQNKTTDIEAPKKSFGYGSLFVNCYPWAEVFVNGESWGTTPSKVIKLPQDEYTIKLVHPDYPIYSEPIKIEANQVLNLRVNLDKTVGYIRCFVDPFGDIYVNGDWKGQTPLPPPNLIRVNPGVSHLLIRNSAYEDIDTTFNINKGDTLTLKFRLKKKQ